VNVRARAGRLVPDGPWLRWVVLLIVVVLGVVLPADRVPAQPEDEPPDGSDCDMLMEYADVERCSREACDEAGPGSEACERRDGNLDGCDADAAGQTCVVSCAYRPPLGDHVASVGVEDPNALSHLAGGVQEMLILLGLYLPRVDVTVPSNAPQWWRDQLVEEGQCHLATRVPMSCRPEDSRALLWQPDDAAPEDDPPAQDEPPSDRYNPAEDGRTPGPSERIRRESTGGVLSDTCVADYPASHYDIGYSTAGFADIEDRLNGNLSNLFFGVGKGAIQVSFHVINYAFDFDLIGGLGGPAETMWGAYDRHVVGGLRLRDVAWLAFVGYLALLAVRGRFALVGSEFVASLVLFAVFTALLANPNGYMEGTARTIDEVSSSLLRIGCDGENFSTQPFDGTRLMSSEAGCEGNGLRRIQGELHDLFIDEPYRYINWNWSSTFESQCGTRMRDILATGPHGTDDWPREYMAQGETAGPCHDAAVFNADATLERTFQSLLAGVMAVAVAVVLAAMALSVLIAKFVVALLFGLAPIAAALAILPGGGRRLATSWMTTLLQAVVVAVGMSLILSMMMIALDAVASAPVNAGLTLVERWTLLIVLLIVVWFARKRVLSAIQGVASQIGDRLARPQPGGSGFPAFGGPGGQPSGSSLFGATRLSPSEALTIGTTGLTAAAGVGALGLSAARVGSRLVTGPANAALGVVKARNVANRTLRNNIAQMVFARALDTASAGGGGGGGGGGPSVGLFPRAFIQQVLRPRYQRLYDDRQALFTRRRQRLEQRRETSTAGRRERRGMRRFSGEWLRSVGRSAGVRLRSAGTGFVDNTVRGVGRAWSRTMPLALGGNPARANPEQYPARRLRIVRTRREERGIAQVLSRTAYAAADTPSAQSVIAVPSRPTTPGRARQPRTSDIPDKFRLGRSAAEAARRPNAPPDHSSADGGRSTGGSSGGRSSGSTGRKA
jgi:hypothetical protein